MLSVLIAVWIVVGVIASLNMGQETCRDIRMAWRNRGGYEEARKRNRQREK